MTDYYDDPSIIHKNMLIAALAKKQKGVHVVRLIKGNEIIKCINKYNTIKPASDKEKQKVSIDFTLQEINDILCRTGKTK